MRPRVFITLIAPLAVAMTVAPAAAHGHGDKGACRQDLQALCPNVTPGPGAFRGCLETLCPSVTPGPGAFGSCLQEHASQLSAACQEQLKRRQARIAAFHQACDTDLQTYCASVSGPRGVFRCLHHHQNQLSQACQTFLAERPGQRFHHRHHKPTPTPATAPNAG